MGSNDFGRLGSFSFCCSVRCGLLTIAVVSLSLYWSLSRKIWCLLSGSLHPYVMPSLEPTHLVERELLNLSLTLSHTQIKLAWFRHNFCVQAIKRLALEIQIIGRALLFPLISWVIFGWNYISILTIFDCSCNIPTDIDDFERKLFLALITIILDKEHDLAVRPTWREMVKMKNILLCTWDATAYIKLCTWIYIGTTSDMNFS